MTASDAPHQFCSNHVPKLIWGCFQNAGTEDALSPCKPGRRFSSITSAGLAFQQYFLRPEAAAASPAVTETVILPQPPLLSPRLPSLTSLSSPPTRVSQSGFYVTIAAGWWKQSPRPRCLQQGRTSMLQQGKSLTSEILTMILTAHQHICVMLQQLQRNSGFVFNASLTSWSTLRNYLLVT